MQKASKQRGGGCSAPTFRGEASDPIAMHHSVLPTTYSTYANLPLRLGPPLGISLPCSRSPFQFVPCLLFRRSAPPFPVSRPPTPVLPAAHTAFLFSPFPSTSPKVSRVLRTWIRALLPRTVGGFPAFSCPRKGAVSWSNLTVYRIFSTKLVSGLTLDFFVSARLLS